MTALWDLWDRNWISSHHNEASCACQQSGKGAGRADLTPEGAWHHWAHHDRRATARAEGGCIGAGVRGGVFAELDDGCASAEKKTPRCDAPSIFCVEDKGDAQEEGDQTKQDATEADVEALPGYAGTAAGSTWGAPDLDLASAASLAADGDEMATRVSYEHGRCLQAFSLEHLVLVRSLDEGLRRTVNV